MIALICYKYFWKHALIESRKHEFYITFDVFAFLGKLRYFSNKWLFEINLLFEKSNFSNLKLLENKQVESSKCFEKRMNDEANISGMKQIADIIHKIS